MTRIPVNLASEPLHGVRPMLVASGAAGVMLLGLLALLISLTVMERGQLADTGRALGGLQSQLKAMEAEQAKLEAVLRRPENAEVLERNAFVNALLYRKGISWTKIFDDLEKVMPHNVRLFSIRPQVNAENEIYLDMVVGAESGAPVLEMLKRLESSPQFGNTYPHNTLPPSQTEPLLRYRISVNYAQKL
jgi:type IV pilus assembly protein PilN